MISFRQLHYFVTSAEAGSATGAAEKLNVSQPSISAAIRDLEHDLGQPLFERRQAKGLELTPFGSRKLQEGAAPSGWR
ncbi:LysR family transcriptional regulator [Ochrobactrum haematophilum]|uniref:LysR family transcriptional regulator n=1 Tax=Brucella haematophila TaxID=419474 RepID=A0ABX1DNE3_9HYPH|nr:LysR family transcriptional regulator [Brucella haematophila]